MYLRPVVLHSVNSPATERRRPRSKGDAHKPRNFGGACRRLVGDAASGDIIGDLEFDTRVDKGSPFPANFPTVCSGTNVRVGPLACSLR
jgi:hypothetical protein